MSQSKCKAKVEANCPYHGGILRVREAERVIGQYATNNEPVPKEVFDNYVEAKQDVERKEKNGWANREASDSREALADGTYYPPMKKYKDGGSSNEALAMDQHYGERIRVAGGYNIPDYVLAPLSKDKNRFVRLAVAFNRYAPKDIKESLTKDKDPEIRRVAQLNLDTPGKHSIERAYSRILEREERDQKAAE